MSASVLRAQMLRADDAERGETAFELADAFCEQSRVRIERLFSTRCGTTPTTPTPTSRGQVLDGGYTWLEAGVLDQSEGTGPWIADWQPGPTRAEDVHRTILSTKPTTV